MFLRTLVIGGAALAVLSCATQADIEKIRLRNREGISRIDVGMSKTQVLETVGTKTDVLFGAKPPRLENPYRVEMSRTRDGRTIEIVYYYTNTVAGDKAIGDDELTPIVLEEGLVIGIGRPFLGELRGW